VYDAYGNILQIIGNQIIGKKNPFRYKGYYYDDETGLYYNVTRYYNPEWGRWLSADDVSYLDPSSINGLNLYAYCGNNPVMGYDPMGTWDWGKFWKVTAAIGIVVGVTAAVVLTAGGAAVLLGAGSGIVTATMTGAAIGGLVAGGLELGTQIVSNGIDGINLGSIAIESLVGSAFGAISGVAGTTTSAGLRLGLRGARVALGGVSALFHGINDGKSFGSIMGDVGMAIGTGIIFQAAFFGLDKYMGKTSTHVLQSLKIDGALQYGVNQMLFTSGIVLGKNLWRNRNVWMN